MIFGVKPFYEVKCSFQRLLSGQISIVNQPEIGIAWITAFVSALASGWLHSRDQNNRIRFSYKRAGLFLLLTTFISSVSTVIGVRLFDVKP